MRAASERVALPLKLGLRRTSGNVAGAGTGSSIDFQDHRPYVPGDDPRHIDWQAYARSGHYAMKLYREEVRPLADLVLDTSASMFFDQAKAHRTWELAWFCLESAHRSGASVRIFSLHGESVQVHDPAVGWTEPASPPERSLPPALHHIPWRAASLRIVISDLLFPTAPESVLLPLLAGRGRGVLLAPFCREETDPDWLGNVDLRDCEGPARREAHFHASDLRAYAETYRNHFELWRTETRRHGIALARVASEPEFLEALCAEGLPSGCVALN